MLKILISIVILSIIGIAALFLAFNSIIHKIFGLDTVPCSDKPDAYGFEYKNIFIDTVKHKKIQLWDVNPTKTAPVILGVHGWANTSSSLLPLCPALTQRYRVILLNTRNHCDSEAEGYSTIVKFREDIHSAVQYITRQYLTGRPVILLGHSLGAAASLYEASLNPQIQAVISISSFADLENMMRNGFKKSKLPPMVVHGLMTYIEFRIGERLANVSPLHSIQHIQCPVLLVHGTEDAVVDYQDVQILKQAATHPETEVCTMQDCTHSSLLENDALPEKIVQFLKKHEVETVLEHNT